MILMQIDGKSINLHVRGSSVRRYDPHPPVRPRGAADRGHPVQSMAAERLPVVYPGRHGALRAAPRTKPCTERPTNILDTFSFRTERCVRIPWENLTRHH